MKKNSSFKGISSFTLHIIAMVFMFCDHLWATVIAGQNWLTWLGRLAFPIFAFMIVEGFFHTKDLKKYMKRLLIWALISEIPFNLMVSASPINPFSQNVMWSFLLGLGTLALIEKVRQKGRPVHTVLAFLVISAVSCLLGFLTMVDYYGYGILMILLFYLFRGRKWWCYLGQALGMFWINWELISGLSIVVELWGRELYIVQQGMACLALIPIWLYKGHQGPYSRKIRLAFYAFYPLHMLVLFAIAFISSLV